MRIRVEGDLELDFWKNADQFELVVAEEEEAFDDTQIALDFEVGEDESGWENCGQATTGRPAMPPPAPAAPVAGSRRKDWRMVYDNSSARRKDQPVTEGFFKYCPAAIRLASEISRLGNDKHNPGEPLHHARDKSGDHLDCVGRHLLDADSVDGDSGIIEAVNAFWRLGMYIQEKCEREYGWPKAPNARGEAK